uniref:KIB1-4 beta-propeller domain-containing protein n=1 Tax=Leersia perrieri TaxID=77586 RepID=A0A0D9W4F6_9ORYZ
MEKMASLPSLHLLRLVLLLLPCQADRVRLRAAGAAQPQQQRLSPPLPWLALRDGGLIDIHGGDPVRLSDAVRRVIRESKYYIPIDIHTAFVKAALSWPLHSDPVVAVRVLEGTAVVISISSCPYRTRDEEKVHVAEIAFCHGKLYALTEQEVLHVLELHTCRLDEPNSSSGFRQLIPNDSNQESVMYIKQEEDNDSCFLVIRYLVESNGRLLMVRRWMSVPPNAPLGYEDRTCWFEVFEADFTRVHQQWRKVDSLGDEAIFLSAECSKSVLASQCASGVRQDITS